MTRSMTRAIASWAMGLLIDGLCAIEDVSKAVKRWADR